MYGKIKTNQIENPNSRQKQAWKWYTCTQASLGLPHLVVLYKMAILRMWGILAKTSKYKIMVPRWRYLSCLTNDLSPSKSMLRYFATLLIMVIRLPTPVPFTSKDRVAYQINCTTTMSKEKKLNKKDIWIGRLLLITCSISKQTSLLFKKKHIHFQTSYKIENIFKRSTSLYTFLRTRIIIKIA